MEKHVRKMILKKITPSALVAIYDNFNTLKKIYTDIKFFEKNDLYNYLQDCVNDTDISSDCSEITDLIEKTIDVDVAKRINNLTTDDNFINKGVNSELDTAVETYLQSQDELECIRQHLNDTINKGESTKKHNPKLVKIHETEKMGLSIVATKKRCVVLKTYIDKNKDSMHKNDLTYVSSYDGSTKSISFDNTTILMQTTASKTENSITNNQIRTLCENVSKYSIVERSD